MLRSRRFHCLFIETIPLLIYVLWTVLMGHISPTDPVEIVCVEKTGNRKLGIVQKISRTLKLFPSWAGVSLNHG